MRSDRCPDSGSSSVLLVSLTGEGSSLLSGLGGPEAGAGAGVGAAESSPGLPMDLLPFIALAKRDGDEASSPRHPLVFWEPFELACQDTMRGG